MELRKPLYSGLAVWLYMFTRTEAIPLNIQDQANHWRRNYNRLHGELTVEEFVIRVNQLETMTAGMAIGQGYPYVASKSVNLCM